jgi:hypothetical protein
MMRNLKSEIGVGLLLLMVTVALWIVNADGGGLWSAPVQAAESQEQKWGIGAGY